MGQQPFQSKGKEIKRQKAKGSLRRENVLKAAVLWRGARRKYTFSTLERLNFQNILKFINFSDFATINVYKSLFPKQ